ncbi:MAG: MOSC domain-containing protein [Pseudomonadota bacterium]
MLVATVRSVHVGLTAPLGPQGVPSAFVKLATQGAVHVHELGLAGDQQADLRVHGGPDKAVYGYATAHYDAWRRDFPEHARIFAPGSLGENLAIDGVTETDLCIGDVHAIGTALLRVCQPRQPCFKFALRFDDERLPQAMVINGRAGWYYRVIQTGELSAGDKIELRERPNPDFSFARLVELMSRRNATRDELTSLAGMTGLASQLQQRIQKALRSS